MQCSPKYVDFKHIIYLFCCSSWHLMYFWNWKYLFIDGFIFRVDIVEASAFLYINMEKCCAGRSRIEWRIISPPNKNKGNRKWCREINGTNFLSDSLGIFRLDVAIAISIWRLLYLSNLQLYEQSNIYASVKTWRKTF